jgi:hypothetical protein
LNPSVDEKNKKQHDVLQYFLNRLYCSRSTHLILTMRGQFMKFCIDCKNYQHTKRSLIGDSDVVVQWCLKNPIYNLVIGEPIYRMAQVERSIVNEPDHCGKEGNWFEPQTEIEDADLDDFSTIPFGR